MIGVTRVLKRLLGIYERPPSSPHDSDFPNAAGDLRDAAQAKSHAAESLRSADREELTEIAGRKESEAAMLRQLADEMELTRTGQPSERNVGGARGGGDR